MVLIKGKLEKFKFFQTFFNFPVSLINFLYRAILFGWLFSILGCDGPNHDDFEQISCEQAEGTWMLNEVACNGKLQDQLTPSSISFENQERMSWTFGASNCQKTVSNIYHLQGDLLDVFGTNFETCRADGIEQNNCSSVATNCSTSTPGSLFTHNVKSCVIEHGRLRLERTSSQKLLSQRINYCEVGEQEVLFYTKNSQALGSVIFSTGEGWKFIEEIFPYNSSPISPVVISNPGLSDVKDLEFTIEEPFEFAGGTYPGRDGDGIAGTCGKNIPAAAQCTIYLQFHPTEPGLSLLDMPIRFFDGEKERLTEFRLEGFALEPSALLQFVESQSLDFGTINAKSSRKLKVTLINVGSYTASGLRLSDETPPFYFSGAGGFPGNIPPGTCNQPVLPGEQCTIEFEFRPDGPGIFAHSFILTYKNGIPQETGFEGTSPLAIRLNGAAISVD